MHHHCYAPLELTRLVDHVRAHSPYYARLWRDVPQTGWTLADLPLVDLHHYWATANFLEDWSVLTGPVTDAIVYKTGGTTGGAKYSLFTQAEWQQFVSTFGQSLGGWFEPGDRVANLFFAGDLYASFLFIQGALGHVPVPLCVFPFTGTVDSQALTVQLEQHHINVVAGVPGKLLQYAAVLEQQGVQLPQIKTVLYGGESVFVEQLQLFKAIFPNARVVSIGCASVDTGLIGASAPDCQPGEHRAFEPETIVEILDEDSGAPVIEQHRPGLLVVTNLTRRLMPIIRYPVGDLAEWTEAPGTPGRKFRLMGRSSLGNRLRVGYATLFPDELAVTIQARLGNCRWQLILDQENGVDDIVLRVAHARDPAAASELLQAIIGKDPAVADLIAQGALDIAVDWCQPADLQTHQRTGKLQRVVDRRNYRAPAGRSRS